MKIVGFILIVIGIVMLLLRGIEYTKKEKVLDAGPVEITKKEPRTITWPYYAGGIAIVGGIILVILDVRKPKG
ncbi:MAG: hypothetical protein E6H06_19955 [Bacteroidetes bacterium]|nr:MAG: hypothetical protein E6H06_19955 [Bacteroidota bacterium]